MRGCNPLSCPLHIFPLACFFSRIFRPAAGPTGMPSGLGLFLTFQRPHLVLRGEALQIRGYWFDVDQPFWGSACCSVFFCPLTSQPAFIVCGRPLALEDHTQPVFLFFLLANGESGKFSLRTPGVTLPLGFQIGSLSHSQVLFSAFALVLSLRACG